MCYSLSNKLAEVTTINGSTSNLSERVISFMTNKCEDGVLKGVEKVASGMQCSPRHLQRILNDPEKRGLAKKTGKGAYQLAQ